MLSGSCFFGTRVRALITCSRHQPLYPSVLSLAFAGGLTGTPSGTCVTDTCSGWQDSNLRPRLGAGILTSVLRPQNMERVEGLSPSVFTKSAFGCVLRFRRRIIRNYDGYSLLFTRERMTGDDPATSAWEADVLPLYYIR